MLMHLKSHELGWAKTMAEKLIDYALETDWKVIKSKSKGEWRKEVEQGER